MKKLLIPGLIIPLLLLVSCASKEDDLALKAVTDHIKAEKISIGFHISADAGKETVKTAKIYLKNPELLQKEYTGEMISSLVAQTFHDNYPSTGDDNYTHIEVSIDANNSTFTKTYEYAPLAYSAKLIARVPAFFEVAVNYDSIKLANMYDREYAGDSATFITGEIMKRVVAEKGPYKDVEIAGFENTVLDGTDIPLITLLVLAKFGDTPVQTKIHFALETEKIVGFRINDKE